MEWVVTFTGYITYIPPAGADPPDRRHINIPLTSSPLAFSAMRAHALSNSKLFSSLILLLSLGPLGASMVRAAFYFG